MKRGAHLTPAGAALFFGRGSPPNGRRGAGLRGLGLGGLGLLDHDIIKHLHGPGRLFRNFLSRSFLVLTLHEPIDLHYPVKRAYPNTAELVKGDAVRSLLTREVICSSSATWAAVRPVSRPSLACPQLQPVNPVTAITALALPIHSKYFTFFIIR
jgi:hypothetical protein